MWITLASYGNNTYSGYSQLSNLQSGESLPLVNDHRLKVEVVFKGIESPTSLAFLGPDDILVLEKDSGKVKRVFNGSISPEPLLDVPVATERERGMLGLALANKIQNGIPRTYAFIYFTESNNSEDGVDKCPPPEPYYCEQSSDPLGNRVYRYELEYDRLVNPKLLLDLPATPGPNHNGGVVLLGPDGNVYTVMGDLMPYHDKDLGSLALNFGISQEPDGRGGILLITPDGHAAGNGFLGKAHPLDKYYAYGIRNSFGMDFDPITGNLWNTENGPAFGDEINLVEPGFNSGWIRVQGLWEPRSLESGNILELLPKGRVESDKGLVPDLDGRGNYSDPEFTWYDAIGVTSLKFFDSDKLGKEYENDMFVGDFNNGNIYRFDLNKNRTELDLAGDLQDRIADTDEEVKNSGIIFGQGFGGITDIEVGPYDGYLYVLSYHDGTLYRIAQK